LNFLNNHEKICISHGAYSFDIHFYQIKNIESHIDI